MAGEDINNLWVLISGVFVFGMTISVGLLEIGELGEDHKRSLLKTIIMTCSAFFFMGLLGFNIAFAPTLSGVVGNPTYNGVFLGGFSSNPFGVLNNVWWSMTSNYFNTGITLPVYFFFEVAFASVTLALVGVVALRKMKLSAFFIFSIVYFLLIWNLPAAWIWNPTGWFYLQGVRDFAGGLVIHGAAGAAGLGIVLQIWREEKKKGFSKSPQVPLNPSPGWLTISILLLWLGWFGFNSGSTLAWNVSAQIVAVSTFLAASSAFLSTMFFRYLIVRENPGLIYAVNGILIGLVVITPLAGFVSPASAVILGLIGGPLFLAGEKLFSRAKWFSDPVGLFPGHTLGGIFGFIMIAFFTQQSFAAAAGSPNLPNGILFGGGTAAIQQFGWQLLATLVVMVTIFALSFITTWFINLGLHGITREYKKEADQ